MTIACYLGLYVIGQLFIMCLAIPLLFYWIVLDKEERKELKERIKK